MEVASCTGWGEAAAPLVHPVALARLGGSAQNRLEAKNFAVSSHKLDLRIPNTQPGGKRQAAAECSYMLHATKAKPLGALGIPQGTAGRQTADCCRVLTHA